MEPIAGCNLFHLHCQDLRIPMQLPFQLGTLWEGGAEDRSIHPERGSFSLNNSPGVTGAKAGYERYARKSFFSYQTDFHVPAIRCDGQDREHAGITKITRLQRLPSLV